MVVVTDVVEACMTTAERSRHQGARNTGLRMNGDGASFFFFVCCVTIGPFFSIVSDASELLRDGERNFDRTYADIIKRVKKGVLCQLVVSMGGLEQTMVHPDHLSNSFHSLFLTRTERKRIKGDGQYWVNGVDGALQHNN